MVVRKAHELCKPKRSVLPANIIFVDTETTQSEENEGKIYHNLLLGVAIYFRYRTDRQTSQKELHRFHTINEFWEYVSQKSLNKTVLYLISHNATFDFIVLQHMTNLTRMGYMCKFVFELGVRFISKWTRKGHTIIILDNSNWFAGKLERWGKELKLEKMIMPKNLDNEEKWFIYCERDCEILYQLYQWYCNFLSENDLGSWKYTIASSAFNVFRYKFMKHRIYIPDNLDEQRLARESYHGGRTECFQIGEYTNGPYYKLDINSMYPYVMRENEYPTCFEHYFIDPDLKSVQYALEKKCVIADVTLCSELPYFCYQKDTRNVYPIGTFRTTLSTEELKLAFNNKWVLDVHSCAIYRKRNIFAEYVDFFYRLKIDADTNDNKLLRSFAKLYMNSLYGKFGQRGYKDELIGEDTNSKLRVFHGFNIQTGQRFTLRQMGKSIVYSEKSGEGYNSFCAIASHVTANARVYLYDLILSIGRRHCFYCDTDSIIVDQVGYSKISTLLDPVRLGFLKIEGISDVIRIIAPKHYFFDNHWTIKGVSQNARKVSENTYNQETWPGFNTILKSGTEVYFNYNQEKTLSPTIVSGVVNFTGVVDPFTIEGIK